MRDPVRDSLCDPLRGSLLSDSVGSCGGGDDTLGDDALGGHMVGDGGSSRLAGGGDRGGGIDGGDRGSGSDGGGEGGAQT